MWRPGLGSENGAICMFETVKKERDVRRVCPWRGILRGPELGNTKGLTYAERRSCCKEARILEEETRDRMSVRIGHLKPEGDVCTRHMNDGLRSHPKDQSLGKGTEVLGTRNRMCKVHGSVLGI